MTGIYRGYAYEVEFKQEATGAWFATIVISRPDGSPLGPYAPTTAHRELEVVKQEASDFVSSEIDRDFRNQPMGVPR
jgi:hypothetical protein